MSVFVNVLCVHCLHLLYSAGQETVYGPVFQIIIVQALSTRGGICNVFVKLNTPGRPSIWQW